MPRIVKPTAKAISDAVDRLRSSDVVAFPTETVYGLGADTFNSTAVERVYALKNRPADNPLIAHVIDAKHAQTLVTVWDKRCDNLAEAFWPGALTLVLPKGANVPDVATAGIPTIALRSPSHPVARKLLETFGSSVSAPSANRSGGVSPTTAQHVADDFPDCSDLLILDGGSSQVGIESTVVDLSNKVARILRLGGITEEQLVKFLPELESPDVMRQTASPGTSLMHYAPRTPVEVVESNELQRTLGKQLHPVIVLCFDRDRVPPPNEAIEMPREAEQYASRIYAALRDADVMSRSRILVEKPPSSGKLWAAINDRLSRAAEKPR